MGNESGRFEGKVGIITGGGSGLGQATAERFTAEGGQVVVVDWSEAAADRTVSAITEAGGSVLKVVGDVSEEATCEAMVKTAMEGFGRVDVLHNSVFGVVVGRLHDIELEDWNKSMAISVSSYFLATKHAAPAMLESGGGSIVNTASILGLAAAPKYAAYATAKHAVIGLTKATALDYGPKGIRANAVCPGTMGSPVFKSFFGESEPSDSWFGLALPEGLEPTEPTQEQKDTLKETYRTVQPLEGVGTPEEIAAVVLYLASDDSSRITGTTVIADGGLMTKSGLPDSVMSVP